MHLLELEVAKELKRSFNLDWIQANAIGLVEREESSTRHLGTVAFGLNLVFINITLIKDLNRDVSKQRKDW